VSGVIVDITERKTAEAGVLRPDPDEDGNPGAT
jgi:hypothetical protein